MKIVVIGAGMSGILMGIRLKQGGFGDFVILEKAERLGGTWRDNTYPGVACDVPSHLYAFAEEPNPDWSSRYSRGAEILRYVEQVAARHDLLRHMRFGQEVAVAQWTGNDWVLTTTAGATIRADAVIAATGTLHHPRLPAIPSLDHFAGRLIHTARWPADLDLAGQNIGVVGTGSSAAQVIPALADVARRLTVFQRTPAWVIAMPDRVYPHRLRRLLRRTPALMRLAHRIGSEALARTYGRSFVKRSPLIRKLIERRCMQALQTIRDPELRRRLTPDYLPGCKRLIFSDRYYPALQRPNVSLVTTPIRTVAPEGIVTSDGQLHRLDVIVLATGFDAQAYLRPLRLIGLGGTTLDQLWRERPQAYRSIGLPGMPNFFLMVGPHSPIANLSVVKVAEWQSSFIFRCLEVARRRHVALSPSLSATQREMARIDAAAPDTIWASGCNNWYLDASGRPGVYPLSPVQYRSELAAGPDLNDFYIHPLAAT